MFSHLGVEGRDILVVRVVGGGALDGERGGCVNVRHACQLGASAGLISVGTQISEQGKDVCKCSRVAVLLKADS